MTIPKTLHYCWFGGGSKPAIFQQCLQSWQRHAPGWRIVEWSEANFDLDLFRFARQAHDHRRWAFVSDCARAWALATQGGVYLDTDCELRRPLDGFLQHRAFSGFEAPGLASTALWGSEAGHPWPRAVLDDYRDRDYRLDEPPNTQLVSRILAQRFGIDLERDAYQQGSDGVAVYPSTHFCLDIAPNYAVHHFEGSWLDAGRKRPYKARLHRHYHLRQVMPRADADRMASHLQMLEKRYGRALLWRGVLRFLLRKAGREWRRLLRLDGDSR